MHLNIWEVRSELKYAKELISGGSYEEARLLIERAVKMSKFYFGEQHPETINA